VCNLKDYVDDPRFEHCFQVKNSDKFQLIMKDAIKSKSTHTLSGTVSQTTVTNPLNPEKTTDAQSKGPSKECAQCKRVTLVSDLYPNVEYGMICGACVEKED